MTEGGKQRRVSAIEPAVPAAFAPLRPLLKAGDTDLARSVDKLSAKLADFGSQLRLDVTVLEGSSSHAWELTCGGSPSAARRRARRVSKPDVRIVVRQDAWLEIAQGKLSPFDAFVSGRLQVGGDIGLAKRLVKHLSDPSVPYISPC